MVTRLSTRSAVRGVALAAALSACGGDDNGNSARDAAIDTPTGDATCGADKPFTGEVVDWDSNSSAFCGVFQATVTVRATTKVTTTTTNPNGRIEGVCVPATTALVDITASADPSECASKPGRYDKAAIVIADPAVIAAGGTPSVRMMSSTALARMYTLTGPIGGEYIPGQAQVVFHFKGNPHPVTTMSKSFSKPQQFNGTQWEPVADATAPGSDVLFPNVDASTAITFSIAGGTPSTVTLTPGDTLVADKFTYVTVVTP